MSKGLIISIVLAIVFIVLVIIVWKKQSKAAQSKQTTVDDFTGKSNDTSKSQQPAPLSVGIRRVPISPTLGGSR